MLRREARISPFIFSILLHALVTALIVTGLAAPTNETAQARLAELFPQPQTVNVRLVDPSNAPELNGELGLCVATHQYSQWKDRIKTVL